MKNTDRQDSMHPDSAGAHGYYRDTRYDWQKELARQDSTPSTPRSGAGQNRRTDPGRGRSRYADPGTGKSRYADAGSAKRRRRSRKRRSGFARVFSVFLRILLCLFMTAVIAGGCWGYVTVSRIIKDAPVLTAAAVTPTEAASYIYDADGNRDLKLTLPEANRDLVSIQDVPEHLQHAFVAIEDARFYTHNGIDPRGIARALLRGIASGHFSEGASTITQQLIKNSVLTDWTSETTLQQRMRRKIQEQFLAMQLEEMLSKEQILQDYMNTINLGAGCYGVQSAAYRYFGKNVSELTLSESAVIAGITQNPTRYNPITNPENNAARRTAVLEAMLQQHYISQEELNLALSDDVYARIQSNEDPAFSTVSIYTSYQDALISQVIRDLQTENGFSYKQAVKAVYSGGLRIYSAQDDTIQQIVDEEMANAANFPAGTQIGIDYALSVESADGAVTHYGNEHLRSWVRQNREDSSGFDLMCPDEETAGALCDAFRQSVLTETDTLLGERVTLTPQPQASVVLMDQETGFVKAISGGRGEKSASLTLNRAVSSLRQPGSTFKILAAYAPALEKWGKTLASTYENTPLQYADGTPVSNWDLNDYSDAVTIREAVTRSVNVAAVRCLTEITPSAGFQMLLNFGFTSLEEGRTTDGGYVSDVGQALVLGGLTNGVTNLELCAAYAAIANEGNYIAPSFYTRVEDPDGNVLLDRTAAEEKQVIRAATAWLLTDAMRDVIEDESGTAHEYIHTGAMPAAGKSGTTDGYKDVWFTGFTPYYTLSIWGGYDNNTGLGKDPADHEYDKVLWNSIMNRVDDALSLSPISFQKPAEIINVSICRDSGMVAASGCDSYVEYFTADTQPLNYCPVHGSGLYVSRGIDETDHFSAYVYSDTTDVQPENPASASDEIVIYTQDSAVIPAPENAAQQTTVPETTVPETTVPQTAIPETAAPQPSAADDGNNPDIVILN